jgi:eukaryotic-like serine/threonine-protein kinase
VDNSHECESDNETVPGEPMDSSDGSDASGRAKRTNEDLQLTRIDHYVLLHRLGQGGMGVVYAAYDETLDRKVAIKLLRSGAHSQPRLVREARAMARVSHPNVVQVYEVGEFEGAPFIAMEFVDGQTLGAWLAAAPRTQAKILAVFEAAGRGLVAAHATGLVHRDFKPDNVMVSRDGRVSVMDFGLARGQGPGHEPGPEPLEQLEQLRQGHAQLRPSQLTKTGVLMGTPAYMAPEQFLGDEAGTQADQFSFCVAVWEALCGNRPFAGTSLVALQDAVNSGRFKDPQGRELPGWLRKVLMRGLAPAPADRWPSMTELLAALSDDPTTRRRWIGLTAAALLVIVGGGSWGSAGLERRRAAAIADQRAAAIASCERHGSDLRDAAWTDQTQARLAEVFASAKLPFARDAWQRTQAQLDAYARAWSQLRTQVCVEVEVDGARDLRSATRVLACLDERRAVFEALLDAWSEADEERVTRAPAAAAELPLVSMCLDENWLAQQVPPPEDEATRAAVTKLRTRLEYVAALDLAADYARALERASAVLTEAEALGWAPLEVEARFVVGDLQEQRGEFEAARISLRRTLFEAGEIGHDLVVLRAASKLSWVVGVRLFDVEEGLVWAELAEMFVERTGLGDTVHDATLLNATATLQLRGGDDEAARRNYQHALEIRARELGPAHPLVAATLNNLGLIELSLGHEDAALDAMRRALAIRRSALGSAHPDVAGSLNNLAIVLQKHDAHAEALVASREALAILEAALGPTHPSLGSSLSNMGVIQQALGSYEDALVSHRRGLEIKQAALGPDHALVALSLANLGETQRLLGQLEDARASLELGLAVRDQAARLPAQRAQHAFSLAQVLFELAISEPSGARAEDLRRAQALAQAAAQDFREAGESEAKALAKVEQWLREHPR